MTNPAATPAVTGETPVTLNVHFRYFDYGDQYGEDKIVVSGTARDMGVLLSKLREDNCSRHTVTDASQRLVSPEELQGWARLRLPPRPTE